MKIDNMNINDVINNLDIEKMLKNNEIMDKELRKDDNTLLNLRLGFAIANRVLEEGGVIVSLFNTKPLNEAKRFDYIMNFQKPSIETIKNDDGRFLLVFTSKEKYNNYAYDDDIESYGAVIHIEHLPMLFESLKDLKGLCVNCFDECYPILNEEIKIYIDIITRIVKLGIDVLEVDDSAKACDFADALDMVLEMFYMILHRSLEISCEESEIFIEDGISIKDKSVDIDMAVYMILVYQMGKIIDELFEEGTLKKFDDIPNGVSELRQYVIQKINSYVLEKYEVMFDDVILMERFKQIITKYINVYSDVITGEIDVRSCCSINGKDISNRNLLATILVVWADLIVYPDIIDGYGDFKRFPERSSDFDYIAQRSLKLGKLILEMQSTMLIMKELFYSLFKDDNE